MVEKVSEASASITINIDVESDDHALLERIDKKKKHKQDDGNSLPASVLSAEMLAQLMKTPVQGGGLSKTVKTAQQPISASFAQNAYPRDTENSDTLRRRVLLAAGSQATTSTAAALSISEAGKSLSDVSGQKAATAKAESQPAITAKAEPQPVVTAKAEPQPVVTTRAEPQPVELAQATSAMETSRTQRKEASQDIRPQSPWAKSQEPIPSTQKEIPTQDKQSSATLQQLKNQVITAQNSVKAGAETQTVEVDYAFQRWSGDHSVKVSLPTQALREGTITLLPSDARAADALSRNMGQLTGLSPELLQSQQAQDEQQQRQQQQQQPDEEQE